jgi:hypothetical protein
MAQISKGDTFTDGQQVTGARLNQLVDSSTLLVGAITEQLEATDTTLVNDAGVLKEATIGDILNSNLPVTTSSITGGAGVDISVTPAAGQKFDVNGAFEANSINSTGATTIGGTLVVTGTQTNNGAVIQNGVVTQNGAVTATNITANLTTTSTAITQASTDNSTKIATTAFVNSASPIKAWVSFNGQGTVAIRSSYNVSTITDNGVGDYTINFTTPMSDANYGVVATCMRVSGNTGAEAFLLETTSPSTTAVRIGTNNQGGSPTDPAYVTVVIYR